MVGRMHALAAPGSGAGPYGHGDCPDESVSRLPGHDQRPPRGPVASEGERFYVVITDVFRYIAIPYHVVSREVAAPAKSRLVPEGLHVTNLVDAMPDATRRPDDGSSPRPARRALRGG